MPHCPLCRILIRDDRPWVERNGQKFHQKCWPRWQKGARPAALAKRKSLKTERRFYADAQQEKL
jgi:hypothetical protein